jgi:hypothetical protein
MCVVDEKTTHRADAAPPLGQLLVDAQRRRWRVDGIIRSASVDDYYLVRLLRDDEPAASPETQVLSSGEFGGKIREGSLTPVGPDVYPPLT